MQIALDMSEAELADRARVAARLGRETHRHAQDEGKLLERVRAVAALLRQR